jgi:hypothetical protein
MADDMLQSIHTDITRETTNTYEDNSRTIERRETSNFRAETTA